VIALAKAKPRRADVRLRRFRQSAASCGELFQSLRDVQFVHVPYKGARPALIDLIGGQINMYFANILSAMVHVKAGDATGSCVTSSKQAVVARRCRRSRRRARGLRGVQLVWAPCPRGTTEAGDREALRERRSRYRSPDLASDDARRRAKCIASTPRNSRTS
jgi:hypothetical protein